jgi:GNAT superfamily N-acetyltransferase
MFDTFQDTEEGDTEENPTLVRGRGDSGFDITYPKTGKDIGKLQISTHGKTATLQAIDVDESHQRQGVATRLYEEAKKELLNRGVTTLGGSLEGSGPVQLREKVFGAGNTRYFHGGEEVSAKEAEKIMDVDFGYIRATTTLRSK